MSFKDTILAASRERIILRVGAVDLVVEIVPAAFNAEIPYFVGRIGDDHYFLSDAIPDRFRIHVMTHEANCLALKACRRKGHCVAALGEELRRIPKEDIAEYVSMRIAMFTGLVAHLRKGANTDFAEEAAATLAALQEMQAAA